MKNFWKYFLIFIGVLVVAFCVALPFFGMALRVGRAGGFMPMNGLRFGFPFMMSRMGLFRFPMFGIGGLLLVGLVVLVIFGLVSLFRRSSHSNAANSSAVPAVAQPVQTAAVEPTSVQAVSTTSSCSHCGKPVQADWKVCPFCGEKL
jgi:hypothetical protein